ncbi:hypothetical protein [Neobacillus notoginsengisoli]|nr:hypothetical protein [Neobacillus notoginsengisoli]
MAEAKIHPLILMSLLINAIGMGMFAYENYHENNMGHSVTFII